MSDNIKPIKPMIDQSFRVNETKDSTEEERSPEKEAKDEDEKDEQNNDNFDKLSNQKDWNILFDKNQLWDRNISVKVDDIEHIIFQGLNLKTNPALLKIRIFLYDGNVINTAFLSVSRSLGLKIRGNSESSNIDIKTLTSEPELRVTVPTNEDEMDDEITRITSSNSEKTFSQTFRMLVSKKTWLQKFGVQDPVSKRVNKEILGIYLTILIVGSVLGFTLLVLNF